MHDRKINNLFVDALCMLAADHTNHESVQINYLFNNPDSAELTTQLASTFPVHVFLEKHKNKNIDINARDSLGRKAVEAASQSGNLATLIYLIKEKNASVRATSDTANLLEFALKNATDNFAIKEYWLDPKAKRWEKFEDGTTEFLAHVIAGRIEVVKKMFADNQDVICESNIRNQNAFYWAHLTKNNDMITLLDKLANIYQIKNQNNYPNLGKYYACKAHYIILTGGKLSLSIDLINKSISLYTKALSADVFSARVDLKYITEIQMQLAEAQYVAGNQYAKCGKQTSGLPAIEFHEKSCQHYQNSLEYLLTSPQNYFINKVKRALAQSHFALVNLYDSVGNSLMQAVDFMNAIQTGYEPSATHAEHAIKLIKNMANKSKSDQVALEEYIDKSLITFTNLYYLHHKLIIQQSSNRTESDDAVIQYHSDRCAYYKSVLPEYYLNKNLIIAPPQPASPPDSPTDIAAVAPTTEVLLVVVPDPLKQANDKAPSLERSSSEYIVNKLTASPQLLFTQPRCITGNGINNQENMEYIQVAMLN